MGGGILRTPKRRRKNIDSVSVLPVPANGHSLLPPVPLFLVFNCFRIKIFIFHFLSRHRKQKSYIKNIFFTDLEFFLIFQVWWENLVFDFVSSSPSIEKQVLSKIIGNFFEGLIWSQSYETLRVKIQVNFTSHQEQFSRQIHA